MKLFREALQQVAMGAPLLLGYRLKRLTTAGKKAKTHTFFLLAGPIGAYAIASMGLPDAVETVYLNLLHACNDLWAKVQYK